MIKPDSYYEPRETPLESNVKQRIITYAVSRGWYYECIVKCGRKAFPDVFLARKKDGVILIETKKLFGVARAQQEKRHRELRKAGVKVYVIDNFADAKRILL